MIARSEAYLEYVRNQPCYICRSAAEPHHVLPGGTGVKGSDFGCIPLCRRHHQEIHTAGRDTFSKKYFVVLDTAIVQTLMPYLDKVMTEA